MTGTAGGTGALGRSAPGQRWCRSLLGGEGLRRRSAGRSFCAASVRERRARAPEGTGAGVAGPCADGCRGASGRLSAVSAAGRRCAEAGVPLPPAGTRPPLLAEQWLG